MRSLQAHLRDPPVTLAHQHKGDLMERSINTQTHKVRLYSLDLQMARLGSGTSGFSLNDSHNVLFKKGDRKFGIDR